MLAMELGVSRATVRTALSLLTDLGHLSSPSPGHQRSIHLVPESGIPRNLRVDLLLGRPFETLDHDDHQLLADLSEALGRAGHCVVRDCPDLMSIRRKSRGLDLFMAERSVDVRIVYAGSWDDLSWFATRPEPLLAMGGRCLGLGVDLIGQDTSSALREALRALTRAGHRRIVLICERFVREAPSPGRMMQTVTEELAAVAVEASAYNFPSWDETAEHLQQLLEELFRVTPPTAIILNNGLALSGLFSFCNRRGLRIPDHLSVVVMENSPEIRWFRPKLSLIRSPTPGADIPLVLEWLKQPSQVGRAPFVKLLPSFFEEGESIGPPPGPGAARGK